MKGDRIMVTCPKCNICRDLLNDYNGMVIRITLTSGEQFTGTIVDISNNFLELSLADVIGPSVTAIFCCDEIAIVQKRQLGLTN